MAGTPEGEALTRASKEAQKRIGLETMQAINMKAKYLDFENVEGSGARWLAEVVPIVEKQGRRAGNAAQKYASEFQIAETGSIIGQAQLWTPDAKRVSDALWEVGPGAAKAALAAGGNPAVVSRMITSAMAGEAMKFVMQVGRENILKRCEVGKHGRGRWRRVTTGRPCAFCAMLAGRGPVYTEDTVTFRTHGHCGCTVEPVYHEWYPTPDEADWLDAYTAAASMADDVKEMRVAPNPRSGEDTILWRMRRIRPDLFKDGVWPKQ